MNSGSKLLPLCSIFSRAVAINFIGRWGWGGGLGGGGGGSRGGVAGRGGGGGLELLLVEI